MILVRQALGDQLRRRRLAQQRTLRDVSREARVSLGYLSEVERGRKEPSSELLGSICEALELPLSSLLRDVSDDLALQELLAAGASAPSVVPAVPPAARPAPSLAGPAPAATPASAVPGAAGSVQPLPRREEPAFVPDAAAPITVVDATPVLDVLAA